jgi:hypothetical protein
MIPSDHSAGTTNLNHLTPPSGAPAYSQRAPQKIPPAKTTAAGFFQEAGNNPSFFISCCFYRLTDQMYNLFYIV